MYPALRAEMARHNILLKDLANDPILSRTISTLSLKLQGKSPLSLAEAVRIKEIIGTELPLEELFKTDSKEV